VADVVAAGAVRLLRLGDRLAIVASGPRRPGAWIVFRVEPELERFAPQLVATFAAGFHRGAR
jgi:hypothetical protein